MGYVYRLPFILSVIVTILVGIISFGNNENDQSIYLKMAVCMVVFYVLGTCLKNLLIKINEEVEEKLEKERIEKEKELMVKQMEEAQAKVNTDNIEVKGPKIDFRVSDSSEDFSPLKVSEVIKRDLSGHGNG